MLKIVVNKVLVTCNKSSHHKHCIATEHPKTMIIHLLVVYLLSRLRFDNCLVKKINVKKLLFYNNV